MKKHKALIAEDTQALKKLDNIIAADDPFAKEPGGNAYVAKQAGINGITQMYKDDNNNENKSERKSVKDALIVIITACALGLLLIILLNI